MWACRTAERRGGGELPLSLDAQVARTWDGGRVELLETVHDRTIDVLEIVIRRDLIRRRIPGRVEVVRKVSRLCESRRSVAACRAAGGRRLRRPHGRRANCRVARHRVTRLTQSSA